MAELSFTYPVAGQTIPTDAANVITWTSSDGQTTFSPRQVYWRVFGTSTWSTSGALGSGPGSYTMPSGTLSIGTYELRVVAGVPGNDYDVTITVNAAPASVTPTITVPAGATVTAALQTVTWTTAPTTQLKYQLQVLDAGGAVVYDTGEVTDSAQTRNNVPFPDTGVSRTIRVRILRSTQYAWSAWATKAVTVTHTPPVTPVVASVTATDVAAIGCLHALVIAVTQAAPGGGVPATATTELYARVVGDTSNGTRIAQIAGAATAYTWNGPAGGKQYQIRAKNLADDGRAAFSAWVSANVANTIRGVVLWNPLLAVSTTKCFRFNEEGAVETSAPFSQLVEYDGRELPVVEFGTGASKTINVPTVTLRTATDLADWQALMATRGVVLYRDKRSRKAYGRLVGDSITDAFHGWVTGVTVDALDYASDRAS